MTLDMGRRHDLERSVSNSGSTPERGTTYVGGMRKARLRRFVWMLVLVMTAGLAAPAFASLSAAGPPSADTVTHVHADGSTHTHGASPDLGSVRTDTVARAVKAPLHCPGCATAAECAVSCFGVAVLPTSVLVSGHPLPRAWLLADVATLSGIAPFGDLDPPRPVSVR